MARYGSYKQATASAQANANHYREPWMVFSDTSGCWNAERWRPIQPQWSGVTYERIDPEPIDAPSGEVKLIPQHDAERWFQTFRDKSS